MLRIINSNPSVTGTFSEQLNSGSSMWHNGVEPTLYKRCSAWRVEIGGIHVFNVSTIVARNVSIFLLVFKGGRHVSFVFLVWFMLLIYLDFKKVNRH